MIFVIASLSVLYAHNNKAFLFDDRFCFGGAFILCLFCSFGHILSLINLDFIFAFELKVI